jgi:hypothetical protein
MAVAVRSNRTALHARGDIGFLSASDNLLQRLNDIAWINLIVVQRNNKAIWVSLQRWKYLFVRAEVFGDLDRKPATLKLNDTAWQMFTVLW